MILSNRTTANNLLKKATIQAAARIKNVNNDWAPIIPEEYDLFGLLADTSSVGFDVESTLASFKVAILNNGWCTDWGLGTKV